MSLFALTYNCWRIQTLYAELDFSQDLSHAMADQSMCKYFNIISSTLFICGCSKTSWQFIVQKQHFLLFKNSIFSCRVCFTFAYKISSQLFGFSCDRFLKVTEEIQPTLAIREQIEADTDTPLDNCGVYAERLWCAFYCYFHCRCPWNTQLVKVFRLQLQHSTLILPGQFTDTVVRVIEHNLLCSRHGNGVYKVSKAAFET